MSSSMVRRTSAAVSTIAVVAGLALVALTGPADAARPTTGQYVFLGDDPDTTFPNDVAIHFNVAKVDGKLKVRTFQWQTRGCGILTVNKALAVSSTGKFSFVGGSRSQGGTKVRVNIRGKFTSTTQARVTVFDEDAHWDCGDRTTSTVELEQ